MKPGILLAVCVVVLPLSAAAQERVDVFADPQNLQVLSESISSAELSATMRGFAMGLGVRCETCHVGEAGQPLSTFDFASDEKAMKQKARLMLEMLGEINDKQVARLDDVEKASRVEVRCMTCHRGQPQPRLIEDVMDEQLAENGIDGAVGEYRRLRNENYGSHSFDFSEYVLPMYAQRLAGQGDVHAAIALTALNAENFPESDYTQFSLGELHAVAGEVELALKHYTRAIELKPSNERFLGPRIKALEQGMHGDGN